MNTFSKQLEPKEEIKFANYHERLLHYNDKIKAARENIEVEEKPFILYREEEIAKKNKEKFKLLSIQKRLRQEQRDKLKSMRRPVAGILAI